MPYPEDLLETSPSLHANEKESAASVVDGVIARISEEIVAGRFRPGQRIPVEADLAAQLGVGRNSLREAIKILVAMGVLEIRRADGTFIAQGFSPRMLDPALYGVLLGGGEAHHFLDLLRLLETGILRLAAKRRTPAGIIALETALHNISQAFADGDAAKIVEAELEFHRRLTTLGGNPLFSRIEGMLEKMALPMRRNAARQALATDGGRSMLARHTAMLRVVVEGDLQAASFIGEELFDLL